MWWMVFKWVLIGPVLRLLGRPRVVGVENLPKDGAAILASNHLAVMDSFFLPLMVDRRIYFLAKNEYFTGTGLKGGFQRWFFTAVGQIPIDRSGAEAAEGALTAARRQLDKGKLTPQDIFTNDDNPYADDTYQPDSGPDGAPVVAAK